MFGVIYVFDHSKPNSFSNIESQWIKEVKKNGGEKLISCLFGNKIDLGKEVAQSTIDTFIAKYKMNYFEVSAKTSKLNYWFEMKMLNLRLVIMGLNCMKQWFLENKRKNEILFKLIMNYFFKSFK